MVFSLFLLFVGAVAAFWISSICGGGASLILLPVLNVLLPIPVVPFALTIGTFSSSVSRIYVFRKYIYWRFFFWFVPFSLPAVGFGVYMLKYINPVYLQLIIAVLLLFNVVELIKPAKNKHTANNYLNAKMAGIGFLAGVVSGLTGAVGLLFNRFYLKYGLTKEQIIATRAANEVFLHLIKLVLYITLGVYSGSALLMGLIIAIASLLSVATIKYILPLISDGLFRKIGYGAMALSGIVLFSSTSLQIVNENDISFLSKNTEGKKEATLAWNGGHFSMEYSASGKLEFEKAIKYNELPDRLKKEYDALVSRFEYIKLEKVYSFNSHDQYEFYAFKNNELFKFKHE